MPRRMNEVNILVIVYNKLQAYSDATLKEKLDNRWQPVVPGNDFPLGIWAAENVLNPSRTRFWRLRSLGRLCVFLSINAPRTD